MPFAETIGGIQTTVTVAGLADTHTGAQAWVWTAGFETLTADPIRDSGPPLPARRGPRGPQAYTVASEPFEVTPWDGITVTDLQLDEGGMSATIGETVSPVIAAAVLAPSSLEVRLWQPTRARRN